MDVFLGESGEQCFVELSVILSYRKGTGDAPADLSDDMRSASGAFELRPVVGHYHLFGTQCLMDEEHAVDFGDGKIRNQLMNPLTHLC
ncbi:MAG: hypothetical protein HOL01_16305 [Planctomycetaceae bacterium]|jgi:hypothetical protein|nr:hypothetical protein [Planctomycetaceae bacterium]